MAPRPQSSTLGDNTTASATPRVQKGARFIHPELFSHHLDGELAKGVAGGDGDAEGTELLDWLLKLDGLFGQVNTRQLFYRVRDLRSSDGIIEMPFLVGLHCYRDVRLGECGNVLGEERGIKRLALTCLRLSTLGLLQSCGCRRDSKLLRDEEVEGVAVLRLHSLMRPAHAFDILNEYDFHS